MKVAVVGATGMAGSRIVSELAERGHTVTAIARTPTSPEERPGVTWLALDAADTDKLAEALKGHDAIVSAVKFKHVDTQSLIDAVRASGVKRYVVVGGAASLLHANGQREIDGPGFPERVKPEARLGIAFLDQLKSGASDLDWTFFSPSRMFEPGAKTGKWREAKNELLFDENGRSGISVEDYATALVNELEAPRHVRDRFTIGY
jgi:putative NADH-flavin reductase